MDEAVASSNALHRRTDGDTARVTAAGGPVDSRDIDGEIGPARVAGGTTRRPESCAPVGRDKGRREWRLFGIGLAVRLGGVGLLWLGDGHDSVFRKGLVVLGVILSVGGIVVLRYLLLSAPLSRLSGLLKKKWSGSVPADRADLRRSR